MAMKTKFQGRRKKKKKSYSLSIYSLFIRFLYIKTYLEPLEAPLLLSFPSVCPFLPPPPSWFFELVSSWSCGSLPCTHPNDNTPPSYNVVTCVGISTFSILETFPEPSSSKFQKISKKYRRNVIRAKCSSTVL